VAALTLHVRGKADRVWCGRCAGLHGGGCPKGTFVPVITLRELKLRDHYEAMVGRDLTWREVFGYAKKPFLKSI